MVSRPSRARGLKLAVPQLIGDGVDSRPSRARGLKHRSRVRRSCSFFAPITGAWIETADFCVACVAAFSRPSRARGLKHQPTLAQIQRTYSRPSRARGLKLDGVSHEINTTASRPSRARGLKLAYTCHVFFIAFRAHHGRVD